MIRSGALCSPLPYMGISWMAYVPSLAVASKANFVVPAGASALVLIAANKSLGGTVAENEKL